MTTWLEARNFAIMSKILATGPEIVASEEGTDRIAGLIKFTMQNDKNREMIISCLTMLADLSNELEWIVEGLKKSDRIAFLLGDLEAENAPELLAEKLVDMKVKVVAPVLRIILSLKDQEFILESTRYMPQRLWKNVMNVFTEQKLDERLVLEAVIDQVVSKQFKCDHLLFIWRSKIKYKEDYLTISNIFQSLRKDYTKHYMKAKHALLELLNDNDKFLQFIVRDGDIARIKSLLEHSRTYSHSIGLDEKKLMLRIVALYPESRKSIEEKTAKKRKKNEIDPTITSFRSYVLRRLEMKKIVDEIPENREAIRYARGFGDFSENAELDAAKERQHFLMSRQEELREDLKSVQGYDFSKVKISDKVEVGSTVTLSISRKKVVYHLLGAWDSVPDMNILSSGSELSQSLYGKSVADEVTLPSGKDAKVVTISALDADILTYVQEENIATIEG